MSKSESSDREASADAEKVGNPLDISSELTDLLQTAESSKKRSKAGEDEVLGQLSKLPSKC